MKSKTVFAVIAAGALVASLAACSSTRAPDAGASAGTGNKGALVGIAMPTQTSERWIKDGAAIKKDLESLGYKADLQYANNDIPTQVQQIGTMITKGAKVLVIASIDGTALSTQLDNAAAAGIKVIAYDRLINGNKNVDYYTTFDNFKVGVQQATSLLTGLGILDESGKETGKTGPFNVELFAGSPDDNNATFFYNGAMETLKKYIDSKAIVVQSGQTDFKTVATLRWDPATAQKRMQDLLAKSYSAGTKVNGVLSPYDGISIGIISALTAAGYAPTALPTITGQDAELGSVKSIVAGQQYSTIYKDTRNLGKQAVKMVDGMLTGAKVDTNSTDYNNGKKVVPTFLLQSEVVTKANYQTVLVDGGCYTADQLK